MAQRPPENRLQATTHRRETSTLVESASDDEADAVWVGTPPNDGYKADILVSLSLGVTVTFSPLQSI